MDSCTDKCHKYNKGLQNSFSHKTTYGNLLKRIVSRFQTKYSTEMATEIGKLIKSHAIELATQESEFLSNFFLRKKGDGTNRPILNLKNLNQHVIAPHFRIISHLKVPHHLELADYMMKIDISQVYSIYR